MKREFKEWAVAIICLILVFWAMAARASYMKTCGSMGTPGFNSNPPSPFTWPTTTVAESTNQTFTVTNTGNAYLTFTSISLLTGTTNSITANACSTSCPLASSATCTLNLRFTPPAVGTFTDTLRFATSELGNQDILTSGTGTDGGICSGATASFISFAETAINTSGTTIANAVAFDIVSGDNIIALVMQDDSAKTVTAVSDGGSNTFTYRGRSCNATVGCIELWNKSNAVAQLASTVTATFSSASTFRRIILLQYSGGTSGGTFDAVTIGGATTNETDLTVSNHTTTCTNQLLVVGMYTFLQNTFTAQSSFTIRKDGAATDFIGLDRSVSSIATYPSGTVATANGLPTAYVSIMGVFH